MSVDILTAAQVAEALLKLPEDRRQAVLAAIEASIRKSA